MKRLFALTIGAAIISLSLLMAPMAFAADEAAKTEAPAAAASTAEKPCPPVKKAKKKVKKAKKKAAKKTEEKKTEEKPAAEPAPTK